MRAGSSGRKGRARGAAGGLESLLLDAPRSNDARDLCGALVGAIVKPAVGAADALAAVAAGITHDCRGGSHHERRRSSIQQTERRTARRRALPALPDGAGPRRLVAPFSARGAAAQALCRGAFPRKHDELMSPLARAIRVDRPRNDDDDGGGLESWRGRRGRRPGRRRGRRRALRLALFLGGRGGWLLLATPGVVVLTQDIGAPWVARWRDVRCAQDGVASIALNRGATTLLRVLSTNVASSATRREGRRGCALHLGPSVY